MYFDCSGLSFAMGSGVKSPKIGIGLGMSQENHHGQATAIFSPRQFCRDKQHHSSGLRQNTDAGKSVDPLSLVLLN